MKYPDLELINNAPIHNFEMFVEGHRSFIDYKMKESKIYLIHTEVPEELQGKGVAEALVEKALSYIEERKLKLVPLCKYVKVFLQRHPEWNRLLAD